MITFKLIRTLSFDPILR